VLKDQIESYRQNKSVSFLTKSIQYTTLKLNFALHIFKKEGIENNVSVPVHGSADIPKGTLNGILKDAGLK